MTLFSLPIFVFGLRAPTCLGPLSAAPPLIMPRTSQNDELQAILAAQIMAPMVGRWLTGLVEGSESESESDSDSDLASSNNISMEDSSSMNGSLEFSSDDSMEESNNDSIDNSSDSDLMDDSSSDSLDDSSSDDSLEEEVQDILLEAMRQLDTMRYVNSCQQIIRTPALIENQLREMYSCPDLFRICSRMEPATYHLLVDKLKDEPVFHNDSNNPQMPVHLQILIALKRFGAYGNGVAISEVADWVGVGHGTVDLVRVTSFNVFTHN